jgi:hypothetical protein
MAKRCAQERHVAGGFDFDLGSQLLCAGPYCQTTDNAKEIVDFEDRNAMAV